jgi:molecular chaperone DnaK
MSEKKKRVIGIDLGTTYSVVSYFAQGDTKPTAIKNQEGELTTPSVVAVGNKSEIVVGQPAKNLFGGKQHESVIQFIKRHMGEENYTVKIKDKELNPSQISSFILKKLKEAATNHFQEEITEAIVTVPAYFTIKQKEATKLAAELAGLNCIQMINEPTAAAISYGLGLQGEGKDQFGSTYFLVYDLGGGTFDISIMEVAPSEGAMPVFNVISIDGDHYLGGYDFDMKLADIIMEKIKTKYDLDISEKDPKTATFFKEINKRIFKEVEKLKIQLSTLTEIEPEFPYLPSPDGGTFNAEVSVTKEEYLQRIMPLLQKTMDLIDHAISIASKKITIDDISTILLVGGSSKTPKIAEMIENKFGFTPNLYEPDLCVSYGAAILGAILSGVPVTKRVDLNKKKVASGGLPAVTGATASAVQDQIPIFDCTAHSLGVGLQGNKMSIIIPRLTKYPTTKIASHYTTTGPFQSGLVLPIYQGEDEEFADRNELLGEFHMDIEPRETLVPIHVKFELDPSGILTVTAKDAERNKEAQVVIKGTSTAKKTDTEMAAEKARLDQLSQGVAKPTGTTPTNSNPLLEKYKDRFQQVNALISKLDEKKKGILEKKADALKQAINAKNQTAINEADENLMEMILMLGGNGGSSSAGPTLMQTYQPFIKEVEAKIAGLTDGRKELLTKKYNALKAAIEKNDASEAQRMKENLEEFLLMV